METILEPQGGNEAGETLQGQDRLLVDQFQGETGPGLAQREDRRKSGRLVVVVEEGKDDEDNLGCQSVSREDAIDLMGYVSNSSVDSLWVDPDVCGCLTYGHSSLFICCCCCLAVGLVA